MSELEFAPDYFDVPGADLILISSDGLGFKVCCRNLAESSEVFASMLDTCDKGNHEEMEEVQLQESAETLSSVIPFIYGKKIKTPTIEFPNSIDFIKALLKYEIHSGLRLVTEILHRLTYEEDIDGKSLFHIYCYAFEMEESPLKRRVMLALYSKNYAYSRIREFSTINSFSASAKIEFILRWSERIARALEAYSNVRVWRTCSCASINTWHGFVAVQDLRAFKKKEAEYCSDGRMHCEHCKPYLTEAVAKFRKVLKKIESDEAVEYLIC